MKKIAILVDGGFFSKAVGKHLTPEVKWPSAEQIYKNALALKNSDEDLLRIFYYDSKPFTGVQKNPVSGALIDFSKTGSAAARNIFLQKIGQMEYVALRCGESKPRGWVLTEQYLAAVAAGTVRVPTASDYQITLEQKGVDMRIGIDVATLSIGKHVDRIVVATNDTDLVPAFKLARRNGIQVAVTHVGSFVPHTQLVEDADFVRKLTPVP